MSVGGAVTGERGFGQMFGEAKGKLDNLQAGLAKAIMPKFPGLPVGKFDDLSIGVDFHPTVVPPSPMMAVPHIGKVYDIMGAIMAAMNDALSSSSLPSGGILGAVASVASTLAKAMAPSVKVHGKWIAQAGIGILHLPGYVVHLLPTVASMSESEMFMGSSTVLADGAPCSTILHPALSCNLAGFPPPPRVGKAKLRKLLMLPTALLTIITSAGKPVLVGGPPTISLFQLGMKLGLKGLGKLKKKFKKPKCKNPKKPPKNRKCKSDPVDMATGMVHSEAVDFELSGPIPIVWERTYYSDDDSKSSLGHNWHHSYDMRIRENNDDTVEIVLSDGRKITMPIPESGETEFYRAEQLFLSYDKNGLVLNDKSGLYYRFNGERNRDEYEMLSEIYTLDGFRVRFTYASNGRLIQITDSVGRRLSVDSDMYERITGVKMEDNGRTKQLVSYEYDENGNIVKLTDSNNVTRSFEYQDHLMTRLTNHCSNLNWYWEYEGHGNDARCIHAWGDGGISEYRFKYEPGVTKIRNGLGVTSEYYYKEDKLIYKIIDGNGGVTRQLYNEHEELETIINPEGLSTKTEYDAWGNLMKMTDENGSITTYSSDERHNLVMMSSPVGKVFTWKYDEYDRVAERTLPSGEKYTYSYENGELKTITDKNGRTFTLEYTPRHELSSLVYPNGISRKWKYDNRSRVTESIDVKGNITRFTYDNSNNLIRLEEADGNVHEFSYDGIGNMTKAKDKLREVEFTYGPMGVLTSRKQNTHSVRFAYDSELQLRSITNEDNEKYLFDLDGEGQVVKEIGFDGITREYIRDGAGRVKRVVRPNEKYTDYDYDGTGNVIRETQYDGKVTLYNYDYDGLLKQAQNSRNDGEEFDKNTLEFRRDRAGRILEEKQGEHTVTRVFDKNGNLIQTTSSLGADIKYNHDDEGNLMKMESSDWTAEWQRDNTGLELHRKMSGGVEIRTTRDSFGREIRKSVGVKNVEQTSKRYHWGIGNRLMMTEDDRTGRVTRYNYDEFDNLIKADYEQNRKQVETIYRVPDRIGNLFESKDRTDRKYGKGGKLLEDPNYYYHYDIEGNLIFKEFKKLQKNSGFHVWNRKLLKEKYSIEAKGSMSGWLYEWDSSGMLTKVINPQQGKVRFGYDALGRRTHKEVRNKRTCWLWDGNVPLHEWTELQEEPHVDIITWVFEEGSFVPCARLTETSKESIVADYLGTPTQMYDDEGKKTWSAELDIYGRVRTFEGRSLKDCPFRYQGQYEDAETGLYYNRFRYYDPDSGSYLSQDPIGLAGGNRLYGYVHDTNSWFDLFGLAITPTKTYGKSGELLSGTATVTVADLGTGTATNASSRSWAKQNGLSTDDAGHIIGKQLGGSGGIENIFPQDCHVNRGVFAQFEGDVVDFVRTHGSGKITVKFEYDLTVSSTRPTNVHYTVESPGGQKLHQSFINSH